MKKIQFRLLVIGILISSLHYSTVAVAEQERTLEILFSYSPPESQASNLTGYKLFKDNSEVCFVPVSEISEGDEAGSSLFECSFMTSDGTYNFALSATFADGSTSPLSPPFLYTISEPTPPPSGGNKMITCSWEDNPEGIVAHRMYMNDTFLCATSSASATSLSCYTDLIDEIMEFSVTSVNTDGTESEKSNFLILDPSNLSGFPVKKKLVFNLSYDGDHSGGFNVYNNDALICNTTAPSTTEVICEVNLLSQTNVFTITAVDAAGEETIASNAIVYYQETSSGNNSPNEDDPPVAQIVATATTGEVPFSVQFDASTSSGDIQNFAWDFGDGTTSDGKVVNHTYSASGVFTVTLVTTGNNNLTSQKQITVSVLPTTDPPSPPTAVLAVSASVGNVPLRVTFDATGSSTPNSSIVSYDMDYGDGSVGSGSITEHTYSTAGTYNAKLTVTDSASRTDSVEIPVLVTGEVVDNQQPSAGMLVGPSSGTCPLKVHVNGSTSSDPDGTISSYSWDLGDGTTSTDISLEHTFNTQGSYTIALTVTDNLGATDTVSKTINCSEKPEPVPFKIEVGEINITHEWVAVEFNKPFNSPVVVVGAPTYNENQPAVIRLRNISPEGFEIRLEEWEYQDGIHIQELVSYMAIEQGHTTLTDGSKLEAGFFSATSEEDAVHFQQTFSSKPVVLASISSENDQSTVTGRISKITKNKFSYILQEEEASDQVHQAETVGFVAWEPGSGEEKGVTYEIGTTTNSLKHFWKKINYKKQFTSLPFFLAHMQTKNGKDTAALRQRHQQTSSIELKVEEEKSKNDEIIHSTEVAGYFIIGSTDEGNSSSGAGGGEPNAPQKKITFNWQYTEDESEIKGFRFYMNDMFICEASDPTQRQTSCNITLIDEEMRFGITSVKLDNTESESSLLFTLE